MGGNYSVYDFFDAFAQFGKMLDEALNEYQNENYNSKENVNEKSSENKEVYEAPAVKEIKKSDDVKETYNITITDYTVDTFTKANAKIATVLNDIVFAMRCGMFNDARAIFKFSGVTYDLMWNKENDRFEGREDEELVTHIVAWDEINNTILYTQEEQAKKEKTKEDELPITVQDYERSENCKFKDNPFYPYGKDCKDCPNVSGCFKTKADEDEDQKDATYDADGNAIADEEIPTLTDYTANGKKSSSAVEPTSSDKITAQDIYDIVNTEMLENVNEYFDDIIEAVGKLLKYKQYEIVRTPGDKDINYIKFSFETIRSCMSKKLDIPICNLIPAETIRAGIQNNFGFKDVEILGEDENEILCTLI